jgi:hypothetical protein
MALSNEHVGPKILAKIKIYILTRAELLCHLCYEIPYIYTLPIFHSHSDSKRLIRVAT